MIRAVSITLQHHGAWWEATIDELNIDVQSIDRDEAVRRAQMLAARILREPVVAEVQEAAA